MSEDNQETDTQDNEDNQETDEEPTFKVGDYNMFFITVSSSIVSLFLALTIGIHVVYTLKHQYTDFMDEYFPTDKERPPFCYTTQSDCVRSRWYRDTNIEVDKIKDNGENFKVKNLYQPDFNIDNIVTEKSNGEKDIKGTRDFKYYHWLLYWCNNSVINANINTNELFKSIYDGIHDGMNKAEFLESIFVYLGWFIMPFIFLFMMAYSVWSMWISQFNAYEKYSWLLKYPVAGLCWFGLKHLLASNTYQALMCFVGFIIGAGIIWKIIVVLGLYISAKIIPLIKFIRIYIVNLVLMKLYVIYLIIYKIVNFVYSIFKDNPLNDLVSTSYPKYPEMLSMYTDYSKSILIIVSLIILSAANTYLTKGISIGMTICSIYLIFMSYANSDKEKK